MKHCPYIKAVLASEAKQEKLPENNSFQVSQGHSFKRWIQLLEAPVEG